MEGKKVKNINLTCYEYNDRKYGMTLFKKKEELIINYFEIDIYSLGWIINIS